MRYWAVIDRSHICDICNFNLTYKQQEMLIKIFQNRHLKNRRPELAADEKKILADFRGG